MYYSPFPHLISHVRFVFYPPCIVLYVYQVFVERLRSDVMYVSKLELSISY